MRLRKRLGSKSDFYFSMTGLDIHELSTGQDAGTDYPAASRVSDGNVGEYGSADEFVY